MAEIYALIDPRTGEIRYIGKANNSAARLKSHMRDAARRKTPVYCWINKLSSLGLSPELEIIRVCDDWKAAEREEIAKARAANMPILNIADGGDEPFLALDTRAKNGKKNAASRDKRLWYLRQKLGNLIKAGYCSEATKAKMRARPDVFSSLLALL